MSNGREWVPIKAPIYIKTIFIVVTVECLFSMMLNRGGTPIVDGLRWVLECIFAMIMEDFYLQE